MAHSFVSVSDESAGLEFAGAMTRRSRAVETFPGFVRFEFRRELGRGNRYVIVTWWESRDDLRRYLASPEHRSTHERLERIGTSRSRTGKSGDTRSARGHGVNKSLVKYLESNVEQLASEVTDRMQEEQPELFARYRVRSLGRGRDPLEWCKEDTAFHLRHLAAALQSDDLNEFQEYRSWLIGLLSARGISPTDVDANFDAMADTLITRLGNEASPAIAMLRASMM